MISVVIPAFNEEKYISNCLESIAHQETSQKLEVIVVDNNSTDNTIQVVQKFKDKLNLKVVIEKKKGRGAARNQGFQKASGDIIFGTEADTTMPPTWVEELANKFNDNNVVAVTGTCKFEDCSLFAKIIMNQFQPFGMILHRVLFGYYWLSGFNFAIRKSVYVKSGGFNSELNTYDDIELGEKVKKFGKVIFIRNTPVIVSGRRFKKGLFQGLYSYFKPFIEYSLIHNKSVYLDDPR
ncbi:glycosyltransferase [Candidatus Gottesmanbacteria bacterium]|nr:glycosyltransferase [Candidatus Gottesmanbacteria bacterium]